MLGLLLRIEIDVLVSPLAADEVEHGVAVGVRVGGGVEVLMQRVDELARHLDLLARGLAPGGVDLEVARVDDLVGEAQRVQRQHVVVGAQGDEVLAVVEGEAADPRLARAPQGLVQQPVGLGRVTRAGVVGAVVEDRVDGGRVHELVQRHDLAAVAGGRLDLVVLEHDVLALADLVALDHLLVGDLAVLLGADAAVLDARAVAGVHLAEGHRLRLGGGVELDRHVDQAEGHGAVPE